MQIPKILQNSAIYTIIMVLQKGISFFLMPLYTAFLSPADYGVLGVVTSISSLLSVFITLGLQAAATRFYYKNNKDEEFSKKVFGNVAIIILANSFLWGSVFLGGHKWFVDPFVGEIKFYPYVFIGILNVIVTPMYLLYQYYLQARQDAVHYGFNSLLCFLLQIILTILSLTVFDLGVLGVLLSQLITSIVFFIYVALAFLRKQTLKLERPKLKQCFKYSLPLLPHNLANWSNGTLDKLLVNGIRSQSDAGMYNVGQQYGSVMSFVANAINQAYVPWFYEKVNEGKHGLNRISQTADAAVCLISLIAIAMSLFAEEIFGIMISNPDYDGVWKIVPCIVFAYVFQAIYFFFVNVLFLKDTQVIFSITITAVAINIGLNLLFIPEYGFVGGAVACLLTYFTKSLMALIVSSIKNKEIRFNWLLMYVFALIALTISISSFFLELESIGASLGMKFLMMGIFTVFIVVRYKSLLIKILNRSIKK